MLDLLYFSAPWCQPCKTFGPQLEAAVAAREQITGLTHVDVDEDYVQAATYHVQAVPTVVARRDGQVVGQVTGAQPAYRLYAWLDELVA
jgi:putative thioredoxin